MIESLFIFLLALCSFDIILTEYFFAFILVPASTFSDLFSLIHYDRIPLSFNSIT